jgi:uncharacterized membrane protein YesL
MQWLEAFWTKEGKGISKDAPKKTGLALFFDIIAREWWEIIKLNILFLLACLPLVTLPAATFATARICRSMAEDRNVYLLREFLEALRDYAWRSTLWGLATGSGLALGIYAIIIYGSAARDALVYTLPLALSLVATAFIAIASCYFIMISVSSRRSLGSTLRLSALATLLHPLPVIAALLFVATLWVAHIVFYPVSVFMPATMNFSLGMFAVAFGAHGAVARVLALSREACEDREPSCDAKGGRTKRRSREGEQQ